VPLYRFDIDDPLSGADRVAELELSGPPTNGQTFGIADVGTVIVTGFVPFPPEHVERGGPEGSVKARLDR
jgi:hypothetical protein